MTTKKYELFSSTFTVYQKSHCSSSKLTHVDTCLFYVLSMLLSYILFNQVFFKCKKITNYSQHILTKKNLFYGNTICGSV